MSKTLDKSELSSFANYGLQPEIPQYNLDAEKSRFGRPPYSYIVPVARRADKLRSHFESYLSKTFVEGSLGTIAFIIDKVSAFYHFA